MAGARLPRRHLDRAGNAAKHDVRRLGIRVEVELSAGGRVAVACHTPHTQLTVLKITSVFKS